MHKLQTVRPVPPIHPISSLRQDQDSILSAMDREPVILSQRGRERAVLVNVEQWNQMVELLEMYRNEWRAEGEAVQAKGDFVEANTLKDALAIHAQDAA